MKTRFIFPLLKWTLLTRLFFFILQILVSIIPDHKHSLRTAFIADNRIEPHPLLINILFGGYDNWDSEYYLLIAQYGYRIKECHAFFPLYPLLMRFIASSFFYCTPLNYVIPYHSLLLISGVLISNVAFVASTGVLYMLTIKLFTNNMSSSSSSVPMSPASVPALHTCCTSLKRRSLSQKDSTINNISQPVTDVPVTHEPVTNVPVYSTTNQPMTQDTVHELAFLTVLMYTVNPATIFMCSVYTESIFAFFSFSGMLAMAHSSPFVAAVLFAGASGVRSNGIVTSGFILYHHFIQLLKETQTHSIPGIGMRIIVHTVTMILQLVIIFLPFTIFQIYSYTQFCSPGSTKNETLHSLCINSTIPIPYSYIQEHYWGLGFLQFYEFKQIPHFLFATPMFILTCRGLWRYFNKAIFNIKYYLVKKKNTDMTVTKQFSIDLEMLPYMVQLLFLLIVAAFFMYIQVVTRFVCSSSPVVFWFAAITFLDDALKFHKNNYNMSPFVYLQKLVVFNNDWRIESILRFNFKQWIIIYFVSYNILGFVMHCNFLPWV